MGGRNLNTKALRMALSWATGSVLATALILLLGVCGCSAFTMVSAVLLTAMALLVGNRGFGSLTMEREKKTLDSLRLTQWSADQILFHKVRGELLLGAAILAGLTPALFFTSWWSGYGLFTGAKVWMLAAATGMLSTAFGIFISSLFETTSRAIVAGWVGKGIWLLLTPVADAVTSAVLVSDQAPNLFRLFNPFATLWHVAIPEGAHGLAAVSGWLSPLVMLLLAGGFWKFAAKRFDDGLTFGSALNDRRVHGVYRSGWSWLPRGMSENPFFMREFALQLRQGAGRWPGYGVFLVLFMAPLLYAHSYAAKSQLDRISNQPQLRPVHVSHNSQANESFPRTSVTPRVNRTSTEFYAGGTRLVLIGHSATACMRMCAHSKLGAPLPAKQLKVVVAQRSNSPQVLVDAKTDPVAKQLTGVERKQTTSHLGGTNKLPRRMQDRVTRVGLGGTVFLLLLYLAIRCSGFLTTAVTGEKDRKSWEDLALTGAGPEQTVSGKLGASLTMPLIQMTFAFPVLLFFVLGQKMGIGEFVGLYLYAVATAIVAGCLGLFASTYAGSSHAANAWCLGAVGFAFTIAGGFSALLAGGVFVACVVGFVSCCVKGALNRGFPLLGVAFGVLVNPTALAPFAAVKSFMPALGGSVGAVGILQFLGAWVLLVSVGFLLWEATLAKLRHGEDKMALAA